VIAQAERSTLDRVNVVTNKNNNNVVNATIYDTFTEQCIVNTGAYLSFLDNDFVKLYRLPVTPMRPGPASVFIAAGKTKIRAVGTTTITSTFAGEDFVFEFEVVDRLSTNVLIGMNFILEYHCVPYANDEVFSLLNGRVRVPRVVRGSCLGLAKLREQVTLEPHTQYLVPLHCPWVKKQSIFLLEPFPSTGTEGFYVPRTILSKRELKCCQLWNSTDEPSHLAAGTLIGQILPVSDILSFAQENNTAQKEMQFGRQTYPTEFRN